jgi:nitroimidazol reductase NimA-like FMN-containing flavoprotein (pyridoxamine 5'-phosphate oxidase superfamily)
MPAEYGMGAAQSAPGGRLSWERACGMLAAARNYWICTTRPDGRPHAMPVSGLWLDDAVYFSTGRASRKAKNIAANAEVVVHLESGDEAVIIEGRAVEVSDAAVLQRVADAYEAKYELRPDLDALDALFYAVRPRAAFAWLEPEFPESAVRWEFD